MSRLHALVDRHYKHIRKVRFLYGWAKDSITHMQCSARAEAWKAKGFLGAKLDICGGRNPVNPKEFLNVDIVQFPNVDLTFDITKPFPIPSNVIAEVFSAATLEHLREPGNLHVMREFFRILAPGGTVKICTPDIEAIAQALLAGEDLHFVNQHFFGKYKEDQTEDYDLHRWMYPAKEMIKVLQKIGFEDVAQISNDTGLHDARLNFLIRAKKPSA